MTKIIGATLLFLSALYFVSGMERSVRHDTSQKTLDAFYAGLGKCADKYYSPTCHAWYSAPLDKLPSVEDIIDLYPNPVGYGTGMDDNPLYGGTQLVALVELYELTQNESIFKEAFDVYTGLKLCATAHGIPGFVARGISPRDGKSIYVASSRDQYTHYVDGLWHYYHSPMCDEATKEEIRQLLALLADTMEREIVPENDWGYLRADGRKDPRGLHKMWHVYAHEAARLPMIYAAAWDVTGNEKYRKLYEKYRDESIVISLSLQTKPASETNAWVPPYSYYQMQCSLALMLEVEKENQARQEISKAMEMCKNLAAAKIAWAAGRNSRDASEVLLAALMDKSFRLSDEHLETAMKLLDAEKVGKNGPPTLIHLLALYVKMCRSGYIPVPENVPPAHWIGPVDKKGKSVPIISTVRPFKGVIDENLVVFVADFHLNGVTEKSESHAKQLELARLVRSQILAMKPRPANVFILGDIADTGALADYELFRPFVSELEKVGICSHVCLGEKDKRDVFLKVFPQFAPKEAGKHDALLPIVSTPTVDFILIDSLNEGIVPGDWNEVIKTRLAKTLETCQAEGRRSFILSHFPPGEQEIKSFVAYGKTLCGFVHGHNHSWVNDTKAPIRVIGIPSSTQVPNQWSRTAFTYMQLDRWEYIFRPVSPDPDDIWERRVGIIRFPKD